MTGLAVEENVRRYRAIASLCRQAAAFRPLQRCSLLAQANEWEHRAVAELEGHFSGSVTPFERPCAERLQGTTGRESIRREAYSEE
ncbi:MULTISPECIES: hypothetical protein [Bradyrhizobium]|uniref:hypothetical protein n=1 Tax=Bradyrhizobium TaxID=374 RepID=UPI001CCE912F|nr:MULTISPECIES: hypothetical protein [Bradyrhizobium]MCK7672778.1 hypothetical protein [Bradyrhizobium sp. 2S1]UGY20240.1 hypothetical protein HAP48_0024105 [Bradyrhizobium septentrionale]UGY29083.1 hypothetical protein HU675_0021455 [Bradyrhizobium septentrionale]